MLFEDLINKLKANDLIDELPKNLTNLSALQLQQLCGAISKNTRVSNIDKEWFDNFIEPEKLDQLKQEKLRKYRQKDKYCSYMREEKAIQKIYKKIHSYDSSLNCYAEDAKRFIDFIINAMKKNKLYYDIENYKYQDKKDKLIILEANLTYFFLTPIAVCMEVYGELFSYTVGLYSLYEWLSRNTEPKKILSLPTIKTSHNVIYHQCPSTMRCIETDETEFKWERVDLPINFFTLFIGLNNYIAKNIGKLFGALFIGIASVLMICIAIICAIKEIYRDNKSREIYLKNTKVALHKKRFNNRNNCKYYNASEY